MGLKVKSQFYYGHEISKQEHFISINEGAGELSVNITPSGYTFSELAVELSRALNASGLNDYAVSVNRLARTYTITASAPFSILAGTGSYFGSSVYSTLGFNFSDKTGSSTYTSDNATGSVFRPQLPLFNYVPTKHHEGSLSATEDESGSGNVEVISFGTVSYSEMEIRYITDRIDKPDIIELNRDAVSEAMAFLSYCRKKNRVEFMEDRDDPTVFERFLLAKTALSGTGLEVRLEEMTSSQLQDYYETKLLTFRKII